MMKLHPVVPSERYSSKALSRAYIRDARAIPSTPADLKEFPGSYEFVIDMPGRKLGDIEIRVMQVMHRNFLWVSGERKRDEEKEGERYLSMERRFGKFMREFALPENANTQSISRELKDGVLTVTVQKLPRRRPRNPRPSK